MSKRTWTDVRDAIEHEEGFIYQPWVEALLTDADALLAVLPFAQHSYKCAEMPYNEPCICGYTDALATLPKHLKEEA